MCIRQNAAPLAARNSAGSRTPPETSLTISAPASTAAAATAALVVSMLIGSPVRLASSRTTASVRRRSSLASTGSASGRVDSPPTSRMSAPSSASWSPCATGSYAPPSENESGVALTMPITSVRPSGSELRGSFHALPLAGDSTEAARRMSSRAASGSEPDLRDAPQGESAAPALQDGEAGLAKALRQNAFRNQRSPAAQICVRDLAAGGSADLSRIRFGLELHQAHRRALYSSPPEGCARTDGTRLERKRPQIRSEEH